VLRLGGLPPTGVAELVVGLVDASPAVRVGDRLAAAVGQAAGNPLYVRELVDALVWDGRVRVVGGVVELVGAEESPGSLPTAIGRRLGFLSEGTRLVLRVAAVLGPVFSVADLGVVTGLSAMELVAVVEEATAAGVLAASGDGLVFRHGLIQQALYEGMPVSLRAALHRQAAQQLAAAGAPVERVAEQLLAGPVVVDGWMIDWVVGAAQALTLRAPRLAVDLMERVRRGVDGGDPRRERLDADLADALFILGENEQVLPLADPVLAATADPALAARMGWTVGSARMQMGCYDTTGEVIDQAIARPGLSAVWTARLRALKARSLLGTGRFGEAHAAALRAEAAGHQVGDRLAIGYALHVQSVVALYQQRDHTAAAELGDRALRVLGDEPQATDLRLLLLANAASNLSNLGRPVEAERAYGRALMLAEQVATPPRLAATHAHVAEMRFCWGQWDEALAELQAAEDLPLDVRYRPMARGVRAQIAVHRDDRVAAGVQLHGVEDLTRSDGEQWFRAVFLMGAWALAAERDGQPDQALTRLLAFLDPAATGQFPLLPADSWVWLLDVVRLALAVGDSATAAAAARACAADADRQAWPAVIAAAQHCQGLVERDPVAVRAAADTFHRLRRPLFQAQALENAAVLHAEHGDTSAARTAHLAAIDIYTDLDAAWDITRADARLRPHNIRRGRRGPRRRPATGWASLTPTEQKIAQLVAAGQSNPDIAAQLLLSRRTVETHVSHILTKLNARSRVEIARKYESTSRSS